MNKHAAGPWVETAERLPTTDRDVLGCFTLRWGGRQATVVRWDAVDGYWYDEQGDKIAKGAITHWAEIAYPNDEGDKD